MARIDAINPNRGRTNPYANLDYLNRWALDQTFEHGAFDLIGQFLAAVRESTAVGDQVRAFAEAMAQRSRFSKDQTARVHDEVARVMQSATKSSYLKAKANYGRNIPPYRQTARDPRNVRDAGGKLYAAISSKDFYRATPNGIGFVNTTLLNAKARQWHRLNFGARPAGTYTPKMYPVRMGNLVAASFGFQDEEPSKGFSMPAGMWVEGAFYPRGESPAGSISGDASQVRRVRAKPTRGIQAWNFLDAGVKVMAERIGPAYEGLYEDWFESSKKGMGPLSRVVDPPAPRRGAFRPRGL